MPTEAEIIEALRPVQDPELHRSIVDLGMVKEVVEANGCVVLSGVLAGAGVSGLLPGLPRGVEATRRGDHLFVLNHTGATVSVAVDDALAALGLGEGGLVKLLSGRTCEPGDVLEVPASGVVVVGPRA